LIFLLKNTTSLSLPMTVLPLLLFCGLTDEGSQSTHEAPSSSSSLEEALSISSCALEYLCLSMVSCLP
jgi:hypothetical protein